MSKYAILGATGSTGSSILSVLSASPSAQINLLVRSKSKLASISPSSLSNSNISIYESTISDISTLANCLSGTKAVFLTVAVSNNISGCSIATDTTHAVIAELMMLKEGDNFWKNTPNFVHNVLYAANSNIYSDRERAERYLRSQRDWVKCTFMMPGGIVQDQTFVSFPDVAAAMIELADDEDGEWEGDNVSLVLRDGQKARFGWWVLVVLAKGLVIHFAP
ncbi:hypothetical protein DE146DRAFT_674621 [Phaeosphaeria sp. MPI-PUGE-AT-0046c]|nr:hypothetical protein DE146DRAFT_674621 [Phaeosphaeria sp. MPI-PUGE-AT-0046c]